MAGSGKVHDDPKYVEEAANWMPGTSFGALHAMWQAIQTPHVAPQKASSPALFLGRSESHAMSYCPISCESTGSADPLRSSQWQPLEVMIIEYHFTH